MASEIRVNKINSQTGVGTITLSPTGVDISGITTASTLRATTGIITTLQVGTISGDGSALTGVASTENIRTNTNATFLQNINVSGSTTTGSLVSSGAISGTTGTFSGAISGTTGTFTGDVDIADKIVHTGDTNTAIRFPSADTIQLETAGSERFRIESGKSYFVGNTSGGFNSSSLPNGNTININTKVSNDGVSVIRYSGSYGPYAINIGRSKSDTLGTNTLVANGDDLGHITWYGADGSDFNQAAAITAQVDGTPSDGTDMPGRLLFKTTPDGSGTVTERMRITSAGNLGIGANSPSSSYKTTIQEDTSGNGTLLLNRTSNIDGNFRSMVSFERSGTQVGTILCSNSGTQFNTSSDHRLKENVVTMSNATDRLKQLQPKRFNFILNPDTTVDGFLAHEVQSVVPEAISGTKDEVDSDNNPVYQGIDQSKLVPLLTAALQEAVTKIEVLEAKVAALEGS